MMTPDQITRVERLRDALRNSAEWHGDLVRKHIEGEIVASYAVPGFHDAANADALSALLQERETLQDALKSALGFMPTEEEIQRLARRNQ